MSSKRSSGAASLSHLLLLRSIRSFQEPFELPGKLRTADAFCYNLPVLADEKGGRNGLHTEFARHRMLPAVGLRIVAKEIHPPKLLLGEKRFECTPVCIQADAQHVKTPIVVPLVLL